VLKGNVLKDSNQNIVELALNVIKLFDENQIMARLYGGVGIRIKCPSSIEWMVQNKRVYKDIDIVCRYSDAKLIREVLLNNNYNEVVETPFIIHKKQSYMKDGVLIDIVFNELNYCHKIKLKNRLNIDYPTLSVSDLLLSKMQNINLSKSFFDYLDSYALLFEYEFTIKEHQGRILNVLLNDYGFFKTFLFNLDYLEQKLYDVSLVLSRITSLRNILINNKKNIKWQLQKVFTSNKNWYNLVEE